MKPNETQLVDRTEFNTVSAREFETFVLDALCHYADATGVPLVGDTFAERGLRTSDKGLVVRVGTSTFEVTVVKTR
jgi:hypothetical protein